MFVSSLTFRNLLFNVANRINNKQFILKNICLVRYQSKLNVDLSQFDKDSKQLGLFERFSISEQTQQRLKDRGIENLFPVQYYSYNEILSGSDCIVQARTGTGKTLAFSLPIVERLQNQMSRKLGRYPRCLVLEPTRELAKQVTNDFLSIKNRFLSISTLYGGKEYSRQELSLKRGSDVVIGTPGRIKDFLIQKKLILNQCQIIVLDEVDRMLDMGFQDDVDFIIQNALKEKDKCQMIVFSATIPYWLKKRLNVYMKLTDKSFINLIEDSKEKTAINVQHLALKLKNENDLSEVVLNLIEFYLKDRNQSQTIVFCQTKQQCDFLARSNEMISISSDVLHGNLSQAKRERVLQNFRQGKIRVLITTDVSARGLDIPQVDLVILTSPPQDWESYIHRSGRTGRAGKPGISICIYQNDQIKQIKLVQRNANIKFTNICFDSLNSSFEQNQLKKQIIN